MNCLTLLRRNALRLYHIVQAQCIAPLLTPQQTTKPHEPISIKLEQSDYQAFGDFVKPATTDNGRRDYFPFVAAQYTVKRTVYQKHSRY